MPDTTAKIRAKGLDTTGVTEDLAAQLYDKVGSHHMAIVEYKVVDRHGPNDEGKRGVDLVLTQVEPATDETMAEHLRELTRTLYYNRGLNGHTGTTTEAGGVERTVEDVLAAGAQHRPHPFIPADASDDNPICDVCGLLEAAGVHSTQDTLPDPDPEDGDEPTVEDEDDHEAAEGDPLADEADDLPVADPDWEYDAPEPAKA